jgi:outer membrane biosynthesis protein TonB
MEVMPIKPFRYYLLLALYGHLLFLGVLSISLVFRNHIVPEETVIVVDIVPIKPITNIKTVKIEKEKSVTNENAKLVKKSSDSETKEIKKPGEKKTEDKPVEKPDDKKISKKITPKIKEKTNKNVKKESDKIDKNKSKIKQNIKTIEKSSQGDQEKSKKQHRKKTEDDKSEAFGKDDTEDELSINERQLIQSKIEENWDQAFLLGIKGIENVEISVLISLSYDGSLSKNPSIEKASCQVISASVCDAIVRSVSSAIIKSSPIIGLSIDRYEAWKEVHINFRPDF